MDRTGRSRAGSRGPALGAPPLDQPRRVTYTARADVGSRVAGGGAARGVRGTILPPPLLNDTRGGRQGFPFSVLMELQNLRDLMLGNVFGPEDGAHWV